MLLIGNFCEVEIIEYYYYCTIRDRYYIKSNVGISVILFFKMVFPSLERLSLLQFASHVFNECISSSDFCKIFPVNGIQVPYPLEGWKILRLELPKRLDRVLLPTKIKCQLWHVVRKFYISVCRFYGDIWVYFSEDTVQWDNFVAVCSTTSRLFCFDPTGEVDRSKLLISYIESLASGAKDFMVWYTLACKLCLEGCVKTMWKVKEHQCSQLWFREKCCNDPLLTYWYYVITGDDATEVFRLYNNEMHVYDNESSMFVNFFNYAVTTWQENAAEYFWFKLTENERVKWAPRCAKFACDVKATNLLYSALMYLKKEKQRQLFKKQASLILCKFLEWPYHEYLFEILESSWSSFEFSDYIALFEVIVEEIILQPGVYNPFLNIVREFWHKAPVCVKQNIFETIQISCKFMRNIFIHFLFLLKEVSNESDVGLIIGDLSKVINGHMSVFATSSETPEYIVRLWRLRRR